MSKKKSLSEPEVVARIRDYRQTFGTQAGKRVLADLHRAYQYRSSFVPGDPHSTDFREGERNVVLKIRAMLKMSEQDLDNWVETIQQQREDAEHND